MVDDFEEKILPFLEENSEDIEEMRKVHEGDRRDYEIRLETWRRARDDEAEIQRTAEDSQGVYFLLTMNPEAVYSRLRLRMEHHYQQLKFGRGDHEREELRKDRANA